MYKVSVLILFCEVGISAVETLFGLIDLLDTEFIRAFPQPLVMVGPCWHRLFTPAVFAALHFFLSSWLDRFILVHIPVEGIGRDRFLLDHDAPLRVNLLERLDVDFDTCLFLDLLASFPEGKFGVFGQHLLRGDGVLELYSVLYLIVKGSDPVFI